MKNLSKSLLMSFLVIFNLSGCNMENKSVLKQDIAKQSKVKNIKVNVKIKNDYTIQSSNDETKNLDIFIDYYDKKDETKFLKVEKKRLQTKLNTVKLKLDLPEGYKSNIKVEVSNTNNIVYKMGETGKFLAEKGKDVTLTLKSIIGTKVQTVQKENITIPLDDNREILFGDSNPIIEDNSIFASNIKPAKVEEIEPDFKNYTYKTIGISSAILNNTKNIIIFYENENRIFYIIKNESGATIKEKTLLADGENPKVVSLSDESFIVTYQNGNSLFVSKLSKDGIIFKKNILVSNNIPQYSQYGIGIDPTNSSKLLITFDTASREKFINQNSSKTTFGETVLQRVGKLIDINLQLFDSELNKLGDINCLQGIQTEYNKSIKTVKNSEKFLPIGSIASNPSNNFSIKIENDKVNIFLPYKLNYNIYSNDIFTNIGLIQINEKNEYTMLSNLRYILTGGTFAPGNVEKPYCIDIDSTLFCQNNYYSGGNGNTVWDGIISSKIVNNSVSYSEAYFEEIRLPLSELGKENLGSSGTNIIALSKNTFSKNKEKDSIAATLYDNNKNELRIKTYNSEFGYELKNIYGFSGNNKFKLIKYFKDIKITDKTQNASISFVSNDKALVSVQKGENLINYFVDLNIESSELIDVIRLDNKIKK